MLGRSKDGNIGLLSNRRRIGRNRTHFLTESWVTAAEVDAFIQFSNEFILNNKVWESSQNKSCLESLKHYGLIQFNRISISVSSRNPSIHDTSDVCT